MTSGIPMSAYPQPYVQGTYPQPTTNPVQTQAPNDSQPNKELDELSTRLVNDGYFKDKTQAGQFIEQAASLAEKNDFQGLDKLCDDAAIQKNTPLRQYFDSLAKYTSMSNTGFATALQATKLSKTPETKQQSLNAAAAYNQKLDAVTGQALSIVQ